MSGAQRLCVWVTLAAALSAPAAGFACACGCGIFDVGMGSMFATQTGAMVFMEQDYTDQDRNWSGTAGAPPNDNDDKRIRTTFTTIGAQYMFNRSWSTMIEIPYWDRQLVTTGEGALRWYTHGALGDVRVKGVYTGLSDDRSTGVTFGVKLPTGDSSYVNFDPDTEIGSGSADSDQVPG
jgi:hypothetical protein